MAIFPVENYHVIASQSTDQTRLRSFWDHVHIQYLFVMVGLPLTAQILKTLKSRLSSILFGRRSPAWAQSLQLNARYGISSDSLRSIPEAEKLHDRARASTRACFYLADPVPIFLIFLKMTLAKRYLLLYNIAMTAGWLLVLVRLIRALMHETDVYTAVIRPLKVFQTGAILEILHSITGLIRAPASTTALQVSSRLMLVWGVANAIMQVRTNISFTTMVLAWSLTEIPRYFYFSVGAASSMVPYWLTWIRYTTFIPLYPLGASSEWLTLFAALPYIQSSGIFSIQLPNRYNFGFDYYIFCIIILVMYIPGLPYMYLHMIKQRTKYVNPSPKEVKTQ